MIDQDTAAEGAGKGLGLHYKVGWIPKGWICWGFGSAFWENSVETGPSCEGPARGWDRGGRVAERGRARKGRCRDAGGGWPRSRAGAGRGVPTRRETWGFWTSPAHPARTPRPHARRVGRTVTLQRLPAIDPDSGTQPRPLTHPNRCLSRVLQSKTLQGCGTPRSAEIDRPIANQARLGFLSR